MRRSEAAHSARASGRVAPSLHLLHASPFLSQSHSFGPRLGRRRPRAHKCTKGASGYDFRKFSPSSPCPHLDLIYKIKFKQPPLLRPRPLFNDPPPPSDADILFGCPITRQHISSTNKRRGEFPLCPRMRFAVAVREMAHQHATREILVGFPFPTDAANERARGKAELEASSSSSSSSSDPATVAMKTQNVESCGRRRSASCPFECRSWQKLRAFVSCLGNIFGNKVIR